MGTNRDALGLSFKKKTVAGVCKNAILPFYIEPVGWFHLAQNKL